MTSEQAALQVDGSDDKSVPATLLPVFGDDVPVNEESGDADHMAGHKKKNFFRYGTASDSELTLSEEFLEEKLAVDNHTLTIKDKYPKAKFHNLVLPRNHNYNPQANANPFEDPSTVCDHDLHNLKCLLASESSLPVLEALEKAASSAKVRIEAEMIEKYNQVWDISVGFHARASMKRVHLHVISTDFLMLQFRQRDYDSFNPDTGMFLPLDEVVDCVKNRPDLAKKWAAEDVFNDHRGLSISS